MLLLERAAARAAQASAVVPSRTTGRPPMLAQQPPPAILRVLVGTFRPAVLEVPPATPRRPPDRSRMLEWWWREAIPPVRPEAKAASAELARMLSSERIPGGVGVDVGEEGAAYGPWGSIDGSTTTPSSRCIRNRSVRSTLTYRDPVAGQGAVHADNRAIVPRDGTFGPYAASAPCRRPPRPHGRNVVPNSARGSVASSRDQAGARAARARQCRDDVDLHAPPPAAMRVSAAPRRRARTRGHVDELTAGGTKPSAR